MLTARSLFASVVGTAWIGRVAQAVRRRLRPRVSKLGLGLDGVVTLPRLQASLEQRDAGRLLDHVEAEWTLAEWMRKPTGVDLPGLIRLRILREAAGGEAGRLRRFARGLAGLGIILDLWRGSLSCLCTQYERPLGVRLDLPLTFFEFCGRSVLHERVLMETFAPRYLGLPGRLDVIRHALRSGRHLTTAP
ncbi:hypothetical protein [Nitrospira sp. Kam-Ns4a]